MLHAFQKELQCQRGLSGAGIAFDQVQVVAVEPAMKDVVKAGNAGPGEIG